jgi:hypothetical protein
MKLTRRAFFEGLACAMATVAIATRMAPKFLPDSLRGGTWKYEQATEKYFYGIDTAKPWDVHLFEQTDFHDPESWKLMDPSELMKRAFGELVKTEKQIQVGPRIGPRKNAERLFVCGENERWPWNNTKEVSHQTIVEVGVDEDNDEAMQACSIIAMSQGFAALQVEGPGPMWPPNQSIYTEEMDVDVFTVPEISTTREELFRHG